MAIASAQRTPVEVTVKPASFLRLARMAIASAQSKVKWTEPVKIDVFVREFCSPGKYCKYAGEAGGTVMTK
ncbi:hypothetical protein FOMG_16471 [Fusarium oxysporum f. sp. melonis 26406]|uniref:Uncharacterized protein n=1 Tax=Fusarium oxysporum f. sp. melonis 26406 TaxID=1089452 RepID=W9ZFJ0_FUSOX|nr:hypothetical protein FOMG_16471 [Fusarium oxysporum f. sp. melonis 26406]